MERKIGVEHLRARLEERRHIKHEKDPAFEIWRQKTDRAMSIVLGEHHHLVQEFRKIRYHPSAGPLGEAILSNAFGNGLKAATGVLEAAIYERGELDSYELLQASFVDPELWEHVEHLVGGEQWAQVASQTAIYVEHQVRAWAGRLETEVGEKLMTASVGADTGEFPLGRTPGERQGWHRFAMGFSMALRNVDTHRIQDRSDLKRYAFGVLGAGSLLLTQLRYQYSDQLRGTIPPEDPESPHEFAEP